MNATDGCLVQADDGLREGVVVGIADRSDRWFDAGFGEPVGVAEGTGIEYLSIRYSQRLADNDIVASVGIKGDSYDNAMIESFNGLYKWEFIYPHGPWHGQSNVEFATLEYVDWFNHRRRHGSILTGHRTYTTPADHETVYYRQTDTATPAVIQQPESLPDPG